MRVFTSGVNGLFGIRVSLVLILVFFCSIGRDATANPTTVSPTVRHRSSLTPEQRNRAVTIKLNIKGIDKNDVEKIRQEVRRKIIEALNRRKDTRTSAVYSNTTALHTTTITTTTIATDTVPITSTVSLTDTVPITSTVSLTDSAVTTSTISLTSTAVTTAIPTTSTPTAQTTTAAPDVMPTQASTTIAVVPPPCIPGESDYCPTRKRRRRSIGGNNDTFTEKDLISVGYNPETDDPDENETLSISLFLDKEGIEGLDLSHLEFGDADFDELLHKVALALNKSGELQKAALDSPVVSITRGLPLEEVAEAMAALGAWLPILLAIIILLIIFFVIFVCCWKAKSRKVKDDEQQKIIPNLNSRPSPSNGNAPPRYLDDNHGWLVPYDNFNTEQK